MRSFLEAKAISEENEMALSVVKRKVCLKKNWPGYVKEQKREQRNKKQEFNGLKPLNQDVKNKYAARIS